MKPNRNIQNINCTKNIYFERRDFTDYVFAMTIFT